MDFFTYASNHTIFKLTYIKNCENVNHFEKEGTARNTIYVNLRWSTPIQNVSYKFF